ncbi:MAG: HAMP domain-containing histidine kinase, partial [Lachnospiraceae bacterium]|nr:HAMP domain-containing histidine kinase [Lachnospiraceae bacterium]
KTEAKRIEVLSDYLEQVNTGKAVVLSVSGEDIFSKLEDEIYKTVTFLYQTKDAAVQVKNDFAENLSNIAHQIKTPITAISLSLQTLSERAIQNEYEKSKLEQIQKQLIRLTHLEESLLVLSRLDAGTLMFQKEDVDVFTMLVLAADNLQELFADSGTSIDIPELGEVLITADLDWTMEAIMNVMKNCMEHNMGGTVHCSYEQNPLYTEILIWDEGNGFSNEDIPHLFKRFYRGQNASVGDNIRSSGIGIGLALSKEIIEHQNGIIRAENLPDGGACFEIRLYKR